MKKYIFTKEEKIAIEAAVKDLEKESCGEIVPVFVRQSDDYSEAHWLMATFIAVAGLCLISALSYLWLLPKLSIIQLSIGILASMMAGFILPVISPVIKRGVISRDRMYAQVMRRAKEAFLDHKVFATEERVGILIFVSRLEHMVVVLGDEGINAKVLPEDWKHIVDEVVAGVKRHQIGDGLVKAIGESKKMLISHGFVRKSTDTNELSDELRLEE